MVLLFLDATPQTSLHTGVAALFGIANFSLYFQGLDYFSTSIKYNAFTHTWSLGIEEQFYLLFPLIFWFALKPSKIENQRQFLLVILGLGFVSLTGFFLLQATSPLAAYYMMPLRFWELGFGVAAATALRRRAEGSPTVSRYLVPEALILALIVIFALPVAQKPIGQFIVVVLTTTLLIVGANSKNQSGLLTNKPARYIGNISYSLYLWHWPFLTFGLLAPFGVWASPFLAISCAFLVSLFSYHIVEQPVRRLKTPTPRLWHFGSALLSICAVIAVVAAGNAYRKSLGQKPFEAALRPAFLPLPGSNLPYNPTCVVDGQERLLEADTFELCTFAPIAGGDPRTLWVMGDSHAGHLQGILLKLREDFGYGVHLVETPGITFPVTNDQGFPSRESLFKKVRENWKPGDVVVLSRLYFDRTSPMAVNPSVEKWLGLVDVFARYIRQYGIKLLLVGPPPMFSFEDIRECDPASVTSCSVDRNGLLTVVDEVHRGLSHITEKHENVGMLNTFQTVCPQYAPICSPAKEGVFLFRDRDHLNSEAAVLLTEPFRAALAKLK